MSSATPLLDNIIEPDEGSEVLSGNIASAKPATPRAPVVLTPGAPSGNVAASSGDAESGVSMHCVCLKFSELTGLQVLQGSFDRSGLYSQRTRLACSLTSPTVSPSRLAILPILLPRVCDCGISALWLFHNELCAISE